MMTILRPSVLLLAFAALLASCATPEVQTPSLNQADIERERGVEEQSVKQGQPLKVETKAASYYLGQLQRVGPRIQKAGIKVCEGIGKSPCKFGFKLVEDKTLNAFADGKTVNITTGIMAFAGTDDAVANILAHEYAHNVLQHVASTQQNVALGAIGGMLAQQVLESQGIQMGNLSDIGAQVAQLRYSKAFEQEADHVGLYISQQAGYNIDGMPDIWRRMSQADPNGIYTASTHPTNPERYLAMQQTIAEIKAKQQQGRPLLPDFKAKKTYF
jgi:predicted Zn-dependent protease